MFAGETRRRRGSHMRAFTKSRWHLDEVYMKINGDMHYALPREAWVPRRDAFWREASE
jgi:hypothetical protein